MKKVIRASLSVLSFISALSSPFLDARELGQDNWENYESLMHEVGMKKDRARDYKRNQVRVEPQPSSGAGAGSWGGAKESSIFPEPSTYFLMGAFLAFALACRRRRPKGRGF